MKEGISRKKVWLTLATGLLGCVLTLVYVLWHVRPWVVFAGVLLMAAASLLSVSMSCCPHCGRYALRRNWPWDYCAGACRKCGRTVPWED